MGKPGCEDGNGKDEQKSQRYAVVMNAVGHHGLGNGEVVKIEAIGKVGNFVNLIEQRCIVGNGDNDNCEANGFDIME